MLLPFSIKAQNITKVKKVKGSCVIVNRTPEQAKIKAIANAKEEALRLAGVSENISSVSNLQTYSYNDSIVESFNTYSNVLINGEIISWEIVSEQKYLDQFNNFVYEVNIDASVIKSKEKSDPSFTAKIKGYKNTYHSGDSLTFQVHISKNAYLNIFLIENELVTNIYPNSYEPYKLFKNNSIIPFPTNSEIQYTLTCDKKIQQENILLLLLSKNKITPTSNTHTELLNWIYSLDQKNIYFVSHPFIILK